MFWRNSKGELKKIILFQPVFSSFFAYGMDMVDKIEKNLEMFSCAQDETVLIWLEQLPLIRNLDVLDPAVKERYRAVTDKFIYEAKGVFVSETISDGRYGIVSFIEHLESKGIRKGANCEKIVIEIADAYYGDGDYVAMATLPL